MTILVALINISFIGLLAYRDWRKMVTADTVVYWTAFVFRLAAGVSVGVVYRYYYNGGDTWYFFDEASKLVVFSGESRTEFFVSIVSLVNLLTANNYWLTSMWFSLFSFWCSYRLVMKLDSAIPWSKVASRVGLLFFPSIVFWSSGIVKETLAFGAVAMLAFYFLSFMRGQRITWRSLIGIIFFSWLLLNLKYYWAAVLFPSMISGLVIHWVVEKRTWKPLILFGSWLAVFLLLSVIATFTHPNFYMDRFLAVIVENHDAFRSLSDPRNLIQYHELSANWSSILINSPMALASGLFRPTVFEASTITAMVAGVENLLLLVLVVLKLRSVRMPVAENRLIVFSTLMYIVVLCVFLALSTPNLGTLSRYRIGFLPFFVVLILVNHPILKLFNGKSSDHIRSELPRPVGSRDI